MASIGTIVADFKKILQFDNQGQFVTLHGLQLSRSTQAQYHHLRRLSQTDAIAELFQIEMQLTNVVENNLLDLPEQMEPKLALLVHTYKSMFQTPLGLPPNRTHGQTISVVEGANLVKFRPYRFPHSQKE